MNKQQFKEFEKAISKDRLDKYSKIFNTKDEDLLIQKYLLNSELSKSLYLPLQNLELTLRNSIHNILSEKISIDWYESSFLDNKLTLKVNQAKSKLKKEKTAGRVISELSFGFWTILLGRDYEQKIWNKYIKEIFPNIPKHFATRKNLSRIINNIRHLRNKVFHFDTIIDLNNLFEIHKQILEFIKWLNLDVYYLTLAFDEFNYIYENEEEIIKNKLENLNRRVDEI